MWLKRVSLRLDGLKNQQKIRDRVGWSIPKIKFRAGVNLLKKKTIGVLIWFYKRFIALKIIPVKNVDEVLKVALIKPLKRVEWVEVDQISEKNKTKKEELSTH